MAKERKKVWDNCVTIGEVRKSKGKKLLINAATLNGFRYVVIYELYRKATDHTWMYSSKIITIPLKSSQDNGDSWLEPFKEVMAMLEKANEVASTMELADDANAVWREPK